MHFHINILIIVSEIFSEECQTADILRWFIHLETEYHIILRGKSELLCVHICLLYTSPSPRDTR